MKATMQTAAATVRIALMRASFKAPCRGGQSAAGLSRRPSEDGGTLSVGLVLIVTKTSLLLQSILVVEVNFGRPADHFAWID